jgi:hypothetical protein
MIILFYKTFIVTEVTERERERESERERRRGRFGDHSYNVKHELIEEIFLLQITD